MTKQGIFDRPMANNGKPQGAGVVIIASPGEVDRLGPDVGGTVLSRVTTLPVLPASPLPLAKLADARLIVLEVDTESAASMQRLIEVHDAFPSQIVVAAICNIAGASDVFERGFITYTNRAKQEMLGVPGDLIADLGAVSEPVARMMAEGALENSNAHLAVAITGVAGPGGGTRMKPVGTVHVATARTNHGLYHRQEFFQFETRSEIQLAAVQSALEQLRERIAH